jgi:uncharacterized membrane protein SpoIIM required for sporulation
MKTSDWLLLLGALALGLVVALVPALLGALAGAAARKLLAGPGGAV